ncbi:TPA: hypothetical protein ACMD15_003413 [Vibrio cholerae]
MKNFVKSHETTIAIIGSTVAIIATLMGGMWSVQSDYNSKFLQMQSDYNSKFTQAIQKLGDIDSQSRVRDKDLEIKIAVMNKEK